MSLTEDDVNTMRQVFSEGIEALVLPKFDEMDGRFDRIESRLDGVESHLDGVESRLDKVESRLYKVETHVSSLESEMHRGFGEVHRRLDNLDGRMEAVENDIKDIYEMLAEVQRGSKQLSHLSLEKKIRFAHAQVLAVAKEAGISLT